MEQKDVVPRKGRVWVLGIGIALVLLALFCSPLCALLLLLLAHMGYNPQLTTIMTNAALFAVNVTLTVHTLIVPILIVGVWMLYYGWFNMRPQRSLSATAPTTPPYG